jgi:hypothetical protein
MAGFGLAGFDPAMPFIALASLLLGIHRRTVVAFVVTCLVGTWAYGVVLAFTIGHLHFLHSWVDHLRHGPTRAVLEAGAIVAGIVWLVIRARRGPKLFAEGKPRATVREAVLLALLLVVAWAADPGFVGGVVVAGREHRPAAVMLGMVVWIVCALWPMTIVIVALALGSPERLARAFEEWWDRIAPYRFWLLNSLIGFTMAALAADAVRYLSAGRYLIWR